jgi:precorrin-2 dehydrogenase/sirohydrochlorin ferrochelatase
MDADAAPEHAHAYYPVFLDLRRRRCVVVGGGTLAAAKARELHAAGARVVVVAERPGGALEALARAGCLRLVRRRYRAGDLDGAVLAIAALDAAAGETAPRVDPRAAMWREAERRGLPFNSIDDAARCSFIAGAVLRRGDLTVAISTAGRAPALAVRLRQWLAGQLGEQHARFLAMAGTVRAALAARHPEAAVRRDLWYRLVDSDVLDRLRDGDDAAARRRFADILGVVPPAGALAGYASAGDGAASGGSAGGSAIDEAATAGPPGAPPPVDGALAATMRPGAAA